MLMDNWSIRLQTPDKIFGLNIILASSQALSDPLPNKNKKEDSLEDLYHMLDMAGCGLESFENIQCKKGALSDICSP